MSGDGCSGCVLDFGWSCRMEECSPDCNDGYLVFGEECEDGNLKSGDGCSSECKIEEGFECLGYPSNCTSICGDDIIAGSEECEPSEDNLCSSNC